MGKGLGLEEELHTPEHEGLEQEVVEVRLVR